MADEPSLPGVTGGEREHLTAFLDYLRGSALRKLSLVPEELARRQLVPSGTSLYWLAVHLTAVEINQFQRLLDGRSDDELLPPRPGPSDTDEAALRRYQLACDESRRILESRADLSALSMGVGKAGIQRPLRWILVHMIEETARHAGHADVLREQLDGTVGL